MHRAAVVTVEPICRVSASVSVSVVVPAYNAAEFLAEALRSIFRNECAPLEVIVVDDGSTDRTPEVAGEFPVTVLRLPHRGVAAARNSGWTHANGTLLAWLDADDRWSDGRLEKQLTVLASDPSVDVVYGHVREFASDQNTARAVRPPAPARLPGSMLIRRERFKTIGGFDETLRVAEFMDWLVRAREAGLSEVMIHDVCLERRIHQTNLGIVARDTRGDYLRVAGRSLKRARE